MPRRCIVTHGVAMSESLARARRRGVYRTPPASCSTSDGADVDSDHCRCGKVENEPFVRRGRPRIHEAYRACGAAAVGLVEM